MDARLRRLILLLTALLSVAIPAAARGAPATPEARQAVRLFVDTDIGADDAVAVAFLLRSREAALVGFSTVAGNTTVENATDNLLTVLDAAGASLPVAVGAAAPLQVPRSRTGAFVHGPTGMWFAGVPHDQSGLSHDAPAAIAAAARANPGMTLLALGPLTNVALAAQRFPADLRGVTIVALAGSRGPGNSTPVSEFNAFFDPHALDIVLESGLSVTLVTLDAFSAVTFDSAEFPAELAAEGGALGQLLAQPVAAYMAAQTQGAGGPAAIPDVAAAAYALRPALGTPTSALVDVSTETSLTRGQTVIATTVPQRVTMIASDEELSALADRLLTPGFDIAVELGRILMSRPDNARVVLEVRGRQIAQLTERTLTR